MKNNKGFTLIELLLTIALLAIISIISFVSINAIINKNKDNECTSIVNNIRIAAKEYYSDNRYEGNLTITNNTVSPITLADLINANYLNGEIIDPYEKEPVDGTSIFIYINLNDDRTVKDVEVLQNDAPVFNSCKSNAKKVLSGTIITKKPTKSYEINYLLNGGKLGNNAPNTVSYEGTVNVSNPSKILTIIPSENTNTSANSEGAVFSTSSITGTQNFSGWSSNSSLGLGPSAKKGTTGNTANQSWNGSNTDNEYFRYLRNEVGTVTLVANWGDVTIPLPEITKENYDCGWTTTKTGATIEYASGANYTQSANSTKTKIYIYPYCEVGQYVVTADATGGSIPTTTGWEGTGASATKGIIYGENYGTLPTPTRTGFTFAKWSTASSGGTEVKSDTPMTTGSAHTIYAQWTANEIVFNNQTLSSGTYGTAYTSNAFTGATGGTGDYTYTILSGAPTGVNINSTNRTISFNNSTAVGTYSVIVKATDNVSGKSASATMMITIQKATCNPPTGVTIGIDGKVTWTAANNATSYQISIDNSTYTAATNGVNYKSTIVASNGNRTVYVRSVCDSTNYNTPSTAANSSVSVYKVTLTKGTGISAVSGASNYIKGSTAAIDATVSTGYTWNKWMNGSTQVSATKAYSAAINTDWTYTANATANELIFDNQVLTSGTYGTAYTSNAFTGAAGGTGDYTYTFISGEPAEATINSSTRKISFNNVTTASTYEVMVKAKDNGSGKEKNAKMTITIDKATCNPPTGVTIGNDGKVTWTAVNNAKSYEISINNNTYTAATSGIDYKSTIIASTGNRTVYVRSICDSINYNTPSSPANATTTVYSVTLTKGTGISAISGTGKYIKGSTVSINATVMTGYTWSKWTQTSGGTDVSTTKAYSAAINANWAYTANASANDLKFNNQTLNNGTFGTAYTSNAFTGATDGTGDYTYTIKSGAPTGATINSANRTISFNNSTAAQTYSVVVHVKDNGSGKEKDATMTITIGKAPCNPPTGVTISTAGKVTWTAANNATGYEISIDNSTYTSATNGIDYKSTITAGNGKRTIYVRSVCDSTKYATPSTAANSSVSVYKVTLTKGTGISAVTGGGNYIKNSTVSIDATVNTGYTWTKWTLTSDGTDISTTKAYSAAITANWSYTAAASANNLTFNNQTLSSGTYGTAYTSNAFTGAAGGTGDYTYTISSGAPAGATINSSTRKIAFNNTTTASTYKVVVHVKDNGSGKEKDATMTIAIGKATCNPPTGVTISTAGKVTWTAANNATGYEISIDNSTYTSATSGIDYKSTIIAASGNRTVYVRSKCNSTNYNTPSTAASSSVSVYKVTLTKGTGISAVTGAGNYIKGSTASIDATVNTGYTWSKWTQTSGGTQVSTTKAYSAAINANWAYTANAIGNTYTATFYYSNNGTVTNTSASCQVSNTAGNCEITIPTAITGSKGTWENAYAGLSESTGNMTESVASSTTKITLSANKAYYAIYRTSVKIYSPNATTTCTNSTVYRNQWLSSKTALATTVLSTTTTGVTTNVSITPVSQYTVSMLTTQNKSGGTQYTTIASAATSNNTTFYVTEKQDVTITFYYYNGTVQTNTTATGTRTLHCTANTTAATVNGNVTIPTAVTNSSGPSSAPYIGVSNATSNASIMTPNISSTKYYAVYGKTYTATFTKDNGISAIGSLSLSCTGNYLTNGTTYSGSNYCQITLPSITPNNNYTSKGWYEYNPNTVTGEYAGDANDSVILTSNQAYIAKSTPRIVSYAFGDPPSAPSTSSTYTNLVQTYKVLGALYANGAKGVCAYNSNKIGCFMAPTSGESNYSDNVEIARSIGLSCSEYVSEAICSSTYGEGIQCHIPASTQNQLSCKYSSNQSCYAALISGDYISCSFSAY